MQLSVQGPNAEETAVQHSGEQDSFREPAGSSKDAPNPDIFLMKGELGLPGREGMSDLKLCFP